MSTQPINSVCWHSRSRICIGHTYLHRQRLAFIQGRKYFVRVKAFKLELHRPSVPSSVDTEGQLVRESEKESEKKQTNIDLTENRIVQKRTLQEVLLKNQLLSQNGKQSIPPSINTNGEVQEKKPWETRPFQQKLQNLYSPPKSSRKNKMESGANLTRMTAQALNNMRKKEKKKQAELDQAQNRTHQNEPNPVVKLQKNTIFQAHLDSFKDSDVSQINSSKSAQYTDVYENHEVSQDLQQISQSNNLENLDYQVQDQDSQEFIQDCAVQSSQNLVTREKDENFQDSILSSSGNITQNSNNQWNHFFTQDLILNTQNQFENIQQDVQSTPAENMVLEEQCRAWTQQASLQSQEVLIKTKNSNGFNSVDYIQNQNAGSIQIQGIQTQSKSTASTLENEISSIQNLETSPKADKTTLASTCNNKKSKKKQAKGKKQEIKLIQKAQDNSTSTPTPTPQGSIQKDSVCTQKQESFDPMQQFQQAKIYAEGTMEPLGVQPDVPANNVEIQTEEKEFNFNSETRIESQLQEETRQQLNNANPATVQTNDNSKFNDILQIKSKFQQRNLYQNSIPIPAPTPTATVTPIPTQNEVPSQPNYVQHVISHVEKQSFKNDAFVNSVSSYLDSCVPKIWKKLLHMPERERIEWSEQAVPDLWKALMRQQQCGIQHVQNVPAIWQQLLQSRPSNSYKTIHKDLQPQKAKKPAMKEQELKFGENLDISKAVEEIRSIAQNYIGSGTMIVSSEKLQQISQTQEQISENLSTQNQNDAVQDVTQIQNTCENSISANFQSQIETETVNETNNRQDIAQLEREPQEQSTQTPISTPTPTPTPTNFQGIQDTGISTQLEQAQKTVLENTSQEKNILGSYSPTNSLLSKKISDFQSSIKTKSQEFDKSNVQAKPVVDANQQNSYDNAVLTLKPENELFENQQFDSSGVQDERFLSETKLQQQQDNRQQAFSQFLQSQNNSLQPQNSRNNTLGQSLQTTHDSSFSAASNMQAQFDNEQIQNAGNLWTQYQQFQQQNPNTQTQKYSKNVKFEENKPFEKIYLPFQRGDTVVGKVERISKTCAHIRIKDCPEIEGKVLLNPYHGARNINFIEDNSRELRAAAAALLPVGLVRQFKVIRIPLQNELQRGLSPLLSAFDMDLFVMRQRVQGIVKMCMEYQQMLDMSITKVKADGLNGVVVGLPAFVPIEQIPPPSMFKEQLDQSDNNGNLEDKWNSEKLKKVFQEDDCCVKIVAYHHPSPIPPYSKKQALKYKSAQEVMFFCSITKAYEFKALEELQVGTIVDGKVVSIEKYGVFIKLEEYGINGLLKTQNVSGKKVINLRDHFIVGEQVRTCVIAVEFSHKVLITLSTRVLEKQKGDVLERKQWVFDNAHENVQTYLKNLEKIQLAMGYSQ